MVSMWTKVAFVSYFLRLFRLKDTLRVCLGVNDIYVLTSYHYAVRRVKLNERNILNERFFESICRDISRDFWSEVKRLQSTRSCPRTIIDNFTTPDDTSSLFAKQIKNCTLAKILIKSR